MPQKIRELTAKLNTLADGSEKVDLLNEIAPLLRKSDAAKAVEYCQAANELAEKLSYRKGLAYSLRNFGLCYYYLSDYRQSLDNSFEALKMFEELGDTSGIHKALTTIGNVFCRIGDYEKALEYHLRSLEITRQLDNPLAEASNFNNLGLIYMNLNENQAALEYFSKSIKIYEDAGEREELSDPLHNIGTIYYRMGNIPKFLECNNKSLEIKVQSNDKCGMSRCLNNLANVYLEMQEPQKALDCWLKALQISREAGDKLSEAEQLCNIGLMKVQESLYEEAVDCLSQSLQIIKEIHVKYLLPEIYKALSDTYSRTGQMALALEYYQKYHAAEKELMTENVEEKVKGLQISFEVEKTKKEAEIYRLQNVELARAYKELEAMSGSYDRLNKANIELMELDRLKTEFIANVSHELKTPLTAISGYVDHLASSRPGPLNYAQSRILGSISGSLKRLTRQIMDLLDFTTFEAGHFNIITKPFPVKPLFDEVAANHRIVTESKGLRLLITAGPDLSVLGDRERIFQVVENLLVNAVKFTDKGSITLAAEKTGTAEVFISVIDTGIGIPEESRDKIFDRFHQLDGSSKRKYGGVGLGLAIVKSILDAHGTAIQVSSEPERGSTFSFTLPAA